MEFRRTSKEQSLNTLEIQGFNRYVEENRIYLIEYRKKRLYNDLCDWEVSYTLPKSFEGVCKMKLIEIANAGTLESSDIQIIIEPNENGGIVIELESVVKAQFGEQVEDVITNTLKELGVTDAKIFANDKGAIDPVIKSRVQTAVYRSAKTNDYKWM